MDVHLSKATEAAANETDATKWLWTRRYYQLLANGWLISDGEVWVIDLSKLVNDAVLDLEKLVYAVSVATKFLFGADLNEVTLGITGWAEVLESLRIEKWSDAEYDLSRSVSSLMASTAGATAKILVEDFAGYKE